MTVTQTARATYQVSLNGNWQIAFDEHNEGKKRHWENDSVLSKQRSESIDIPSSWENIRANYEGVAWFRKQFDVPSAWQGKSVRLHFDAVSYLTEVWLNGEIVGYHEGGYDPFELTIDNIARFGGTNTLILRVISPIVLSDDLYIDGMTKWEAPHWRGALIAGIWQDAYLKVTEKTYIEDLFVETSLDGKTKLNLTVNNALDKTFDGNIACSIREWSKEGDKVVLWKKIEKSSIQPGNNIFTVDATIQNPKLWSPEVPNLYEAIVTINGEDAYTVRFGVREFTLTKEGFLFNGKKFYMKAGFWEGLYPVGLAVPDSPEMLQKEIELAKKANFNTLRPWRKPPAPWLLDMADEMGILIIGAPALECMNEKPAIAGQLNRRVFHEIEAMVSRDRNHPSVVMWELFNEVKRDAIGRLKHESSLRARAMDPTRLIIDESGGWSGGCKAYLPYSREYIPFNEIHSYQKAPLRESVYTLYRKLADGSEKASGWSILKPGAVSIISEVGYGSFSDLEADMRSFREKGNPLAPTYTSHEKLYESMKKVMSEIGLNDIFGDLSKMGLASQAVQSEGNKLMIEALRLNPHISGYCIHAYTDGDWVIGAGVLDIWRNPKLQYEMLKQVNAPLYVSARVEPANIYAGSEVKIKSGVVSELEHTTHGILKATLSTIRGKKIWSKSIPVNPPWGVTMALDEKVIIPENVTGECILTIIFSDGKKELARNTFTCHSFAPVKKNEVKSPKKMVVFDIDSPKGNGKFRTWLDKRGVAYTGNIPAEVNNDNLVIFTTVENPNKEELGLYRDIFDRVKQGATLVMLNPPLKKSQYKLADPPKVDHITTNNLFYTEKIFPFDLVERAAKGNWVPNNHAVAPSHPYFAGLPSKCFMGQLYANVAPLRTMMGLKQKPVVSSVSFTIDRSYLGIKEAWWGSDLTRVPYGKGAVILSTLLLIPNLDSDPVADIIMKNMINNTMNDVYVNI
ncbi:MAG: hypothetical protein LLF80_04775 [Porphyromonadaceae bacterium]|nr:hypothetical protein [Porphyromonadaceae bacterium]